MKTSNLLKTSLGVLLTTIIILGVVEYIEKGKLKTCESRQSVRCPRFTCPIKDDQCGDRPWICDVDDQTCSKGKKCIGYCTTGEKNCYA